MTRGSWSARVLADLRGHFIPPYVGRHKAINYDEYNDFPLELTGGLPHNEIAEGFSLELGIMDIILAITIAWVSALAGTGIAYSLLEKRLNIQEQRHRSRTRQEIEEVERTYTQRMQNRIDSLKSQYETQIQQLKVSLGGQATESLIPSEGEVSLTEVSLTEATLANEGTSPGVLVQSPEVPSPETQSPETIAIADQPEVNLEEGEHSHESLAMQDSVPSAVENDRPQDSPAIVSSLYAFSFKDLATLSHPSSIETRIILVEQILEILTAQEPLEIPSRPLIHVLIALSRDTEPRLRELAIRSLAQIRSPLTLPTLRRGLRDADSRVIKAAHQALEPWRAKAKVTPKITKALRSAQRLVKAKR